MYKQVVSNSSKINTILSPPASRQIFLAQTLTRGRPFRFRSGVSSKFVKVVSVVKMPLGIGEYPAEYNPKVHGQYSPARYYGKRTWFSVIKTFPQAKCEHFVAGLTGESITGSGIGVAAWLLEGRWQRRRRRAPCDCWVAVWNRNYISISD